MVSMENMQGGSCVGMKKDMREHISLQLKRLLKYLVTNLVTVQAVARIPYTFGDL